MSGGRIEIQTFFGRCRCCLSYGYLKNMWTEHNFEGETEIYGEMLIQCFALSLEHSEDTMDQDQICDQCIGRLRDATDFKKVVLDSQEELLHRYHLVKEEELQVEYLEDTAETIYDDTDYNADIDNAGGIVKDEMEYQEIEYLEDDDLANTEDVNDTDSSQPSETKTAARMKKRRCQPDDEDSTKRKWPKKLPKAERLKTYKQYSEEMFRKCMEAVRNGEMSPQEASIEFKVPKKTICAKLKMDPKDVLIDNTTESELLTPTKSELQRKTTESTREVAVDNDVKENNKPVKENEAATDSQQPQTVEDNAKPEYNELNKHKNNIMAVLQHSNATIIKDAGRNGYYCNFCEKQWYAPLELKLHNIKSHARQIHEVVDTNDVSELVIKLDITGLKCILCRKSIDSLDILLQHLSKVHSLLIYTDIKNYMIPFNFETDDLTCVKCHKSFNYFNILAEHMYEHYRNFKCSLCDRCFITKESLVSHMYKHKGGVFQCPNCPKVFETQPKRQEHMKYEHKAPSISRKCAHCDQRFLTWNLLVKHELQAHGVKPPVFSCDECGKTCITQSSLTHHKIHFHMQQKLYKCPRCVKTFLSTTALEAHVNTHTKPRENVCNICDKKFSSQSSLNKHNKVHFLDMKSI